MRWKTRVDREMEWNRKWGALSAYPAERHRGIVHTPEYVAKMAEKQKRYDAEMLAKYEADPNVILPRTGEAV